MTNGKREEIKIGIVKIKDTEFFVDETIDKPLNTEVNIHFDYGLSFDVEKDWIEVLITVCFNLLPEKHCFIRTKTSNVFYFENLKKYQNKNHQDHYDIPDEAILTMLSLSISHTRALMAKNATGTNFAEFYLPIVNPSFFLKKLTANAALIKQK